MKHLKTCPKCHAKLEIKPDREFQYCNICNYWTKVGTARLDSMKRVRVFAGPNGSGKSTMVDRVIEVGRRHFGHELINPNRHINPDDLNTIDEIDFGEFGLRVDETHFRDSMLRSPFYKKCNIYIDDFTVNNNCFNIPKRNSYVGAMLADYLRDCYVKSDEQLFSFETVFSHQSKIEFLECANYDEWLVYLYYVCTEDPSINLDRVDKRVKKGGHYVPPDKIVDRYYRSLEHLYPALPHCRRAYFYDNTIKMQYIAEKKLDDSFDFKVDILPAWFNEYVLSKSI